MSCSYKLLFKTEEVKMTIKLNCIICKKVIKHPWVGQITCGSKECVKEYSKKSHKIWRTKNRDYWNALQRKYNKKKYHEKYPNARWYKERGKNES